MGSKVKGLYLGYIYIYAISPFVYGIKSKWLIPLVKYAISPFVEGSLEVKLPTIWRDEKQSRAEAQRRGRLEERRSEEKE